MTAKTKPDNTVPAPRRHLTEMSDTASLPRERALQHGMSGLSDTEVMAILLGSGIRGKNVLDLSSEIIKSHDGHLSSLSRMSANEIVRQYAGIGQGKALALLAALELGKRAAHDAAQVELARKAITDSKSCYELMRHHFTGLKHEEFWILLLNNSLRRIAEIRISRGSATATIVEPRIIVKLMMEHDAMHAVLFHNHPSGNLKPSSQDDNLTRKITEAARLFDFRIVDHIILSESGYYSYMDSGRM